MRLPGRPRFGDVIQRQLAMFDVEHRSLLARIEEARREYGRAGSEDAEELYGNYMDLVEEAEDHLLELRDHFALSMSAGDRERYRREFARAAKRRLPSLAARRDYERTMDPDLDE
jgi:hypothetical protein